MGVGVGVTSAAVHQSRPTEYILLNFTSLYFTSVVALQLYSYLFLEAIDQSDLLHFASL